MSSIGLMEIANDRGFLRRVQFAMFEVSKDKVIAAATGNSLAYLQGILNGEAPVSQMALGVLLNSAVATAGRAATDAQIKAAVEQVWSHYANAWAVRAV